MNDKLALSININSLFSLPCHWVVLFSVESIDSDENFLLLSSDEKKRADCFKSKIDRACFIHAHAFKRYCLARLMNADPSALIFSCTDKGKPFLEHEKIIDFNISHSNGWVAFGVSSLGVIGVDIERADRIISKKTIEYALNSRQILTLEETENTVEKMMLYWTQKEAISKALGVGISIGFKSIECSGEFGESHADCKDQQFLIQSYKHKSHKQNNVVLSLAAQSKSSVQVCQISSWINCVANDNNARNKDDENIQLEKIILNIF
jgi:4'-phosphopantetheinyl transferase